MITEITQEVAKKFRSFGGGNSNPYNFLSKVLKDNPAQFAAGVDIRSVVNVVATKVLLDLMRKTKDIASEKRCSVDIALLEAVEEMENELRADVPNIVWD